MKQAMKLSSGSTKNDQDVYSFESASRGFHVYRRVWNARVGERLQAKQEDSNNEDRYAVALTKDNLTVGHVPQEQSSILWYFLSHGGKLTAKVTGRHRRSPLIQGGLEIPCTFTVEGSKRLVQKLQELIV